MCEQYTISPTLYYQWERIAEQASLKAFDDQQQGRKKPRASEEQLLADHRTYYNQRRPYSALHYRCPLEY